MTSNKKKNASKNGKGKESAKQLPVTILSGFLGAGKTTVLKHLLESNDHKLKIAVIVNDMATLNIDAALVEKSGLVQTKQEVVSMQNGCICCTLRADLIREVSRLQKEGRFDYLVIESSGISEPMQVAESFTADPNTLAVSENELDMLANFAKLDTLVTVVDARELPLMMNSVQTFREKFANADGGADAEGEEGEKHLSQLLIEQIEFANVILLNKTDLVTAVQLNQARTLIQTLNPSARVVTCLFGQVDCSEILNTKLFDMEEAKSAPGWLQSLRRTTDEESAPEVGGKDDEKVDKAKQRKRSRSEMPPTLRPFTDTHDIKTETAEYGVSSFVYRRRAPFHPARLNTFLTQFFQLTSDGNEQLGPTQSSESSLQGIKPWSAKRRQDATQRDAVQLSALQSSFGWVLRSKGFCWVAGRDGVMIEWAQAGRFLRLSPLMRWFVDTPEEMWGCASDEEKGLIKKSFYEQAVANKEVELNDNVTAADALGDRRQELVFIGSGLQREKLEAALDTCLLTPEEQADHVLNLSFEQGNNELAVRNNAQYFDPLPIWTQLVDTPNAMWSAVVRAGQPSRLAVIPGLTLSISQVALRLALPSLSTLLSHNDDGKVKASELESILSTLEEDCAVQIWLDHHENPDNIAMQVSSRLLCTLRPGRTEQVSLNLHLCGGSTGAEEEEEDETNQDGMDGECTTGACPPERTAHNQSHDHHHDHAHEHGKDNASQPQHFTLRAVVVFTSFKRRFQQHSVLEQKSVASSALQLSDFFHLMEVHVMSHTHLALEESAQEEDDEENETEELESEVESVVEEIPTKTGKKNSGKK